MDNIESDIPFHISDSYFDCLSIAYKERRHLTEHLNCGCGTFQAQHSWKGSVAFTPIRRGRFVLICSTIILSKTVTPSVSVLVQLENSVKEKVDIFILKG